MLSVVNHCSMKLVDMRFFAIFLTVLVFAAVTTHCSPAAKENSVDDLGLEEYLDLERNSYNPEATGRSEIGIEDKVGQFLKSYDANFNVPFVGKVTLEGRNLDNDELNLKVKMSSAVEERGKKNKLKKIFVPIFIIMLLKVITLIPLALGVLGLKTWNALQLSFVTFVISISMAVYQLCRKLAADSHPPIATHGPWDAHRKRSFDDDVAQKMAYSAYTL